MKEVLCSGLCSTCKHVGHLSDSVFVRTAVCVKKFWLDKKYKLSPTKPVLKCKYFEPLTNTIIKEVNHANEL